MTARDAPAGAPPRPDPDPDPDPRLPDRTPASTAAQSKRRVQQTCVVCGAAYLMAPGAARSCQTCSRACSTQLRSRQRTGRSLPRTSAKTKGAAPGTETETETGTGTETETETETARPSGDGDGDGDDDDDAAQGPAQRPDIAVVGRSHLRVSCIRCGGLRGKWGVREVPPPALCWRCLMRQNGGLGPGLPPG